MREAREEYYSTKSIEGGDEENAERKLSNDTILVSKADVKVNFIFSDDVSVKEV